MSAPCESNDNFALMDLSDTLSVSTRLSSTQNNYGSGCNYADSTNAVQDPDSDEVSPSSITTSSVVTFLSCKFTDALELAKSNNIERIKLAYNYDIHVTNAADLAFSVSVFELDLLKAIANEFGLSSCAFGRRSLRFGRRKLSSTGVIAGVGSNPGDVVDTTRNCMEMLVSSDESSTCTPMIGFMTAWVDKTSGGGFVKSDINTIIENYSKDYSTKEGVLSVSYIGTRPEVVMSDAELAFLNEGSAMAPGALAGVVASVLSLLTVFALVAMKRRYKNMNVNRSEKLSSSTNNALVVGSDDEDNDVFEIVISDDSIYSANTECCTVGETKLPTKSSQDEGGPSEGEGIEFSHDQVIKMRDNSHP